MPNDGDDRTAKARIRDAALECFAADGVAATSIRAIAARAGVSPGLVIHHYGSKDALRVACDAYVVSEIRRIKTAGIAPTASVDPLAVLRDLQDRPLRRYLVRTLSDGSPHVAELVEELVASGLEVSRQAERAGLVNPSDDEYGRAVVITLGSLGSMVLHEHFERLLGEDILNAAPASSRYLATVLEMWGRPVLTEAAYHQWRDAMARTAAVATTADPPERERGQPP